MIQKKLKWKINKKLITKQYHTINAGTPNFADDQNVPRKKRKQDEVYIVVYASCDVDIFITY